MSSVKTIDICCEKETVDMAKGFSVFTTNIDLDENVRGIILPEEDNVNRLILNPYYQGGKLVIKTRVVGPVPKRYKPGDKIGTLVLLD